MKKQFNDWYKVRHNIVEGRLAEDPDAVVVEGLWDKISGTAGAGTGAAVGAGVGALGGPAGSLLGGAVGAGIGALGGWAASPWMKQKYDRFHQARQQAATDPANAEAARIDPEVKRQVQTFANNLGLDATAVTDHRLRDSLTNIYIARIYGQKSGIIIDEGDLSSIWEALQREVGKGRKITTLAKRYGITRPFVIINKVPDVRPGIKYGITRDAVNYDLKIIKQQEQQQAARSTPGVAPRPGGDIPRSDPSRVGGGDLSGGDLHDYIDTWLNKTVSGTTTTVRDIVQRHTGHVFPKRFNMKGLPEFIQWIEEAADATGSRPEKKLLRRVLTFLNRI